MSSLARIGLVVRLNLLRNLRSPIYLASMVVIPLLVVVIQTTVVGSGTDAFPVGVVATGDGPLTRRLMTGLDQSEVVELQRYGSERELRTALRADEVVAGVVVPEGFDTSLRSGGTAEARLLANPTRAVAGAARAAVAAEVEELAAVVQAARFTEQQAGVGRVAAFDHAERLSAPRVRAERDRPSGRPLESEGGYSYGVRSTIVFFMFATAMSAAALLVDMRRRGIVGRLLAGPLNATELMVGEGISRLAVTLVQAGVIVVAGTLLFDATWDDASAVVLILGAFSVVCTAVALLVGAMARTFEQAIVFGSAGAIALGMAGGCLWPLDVTPPALRWLAQLTPHWWALEALLDSAVVPAAPSDLGPDLLVLGGFAVLAFPLAVWRLNRTVAG